MDQIRYMLSACLIFVCFVSAYALLKPIVNSVQRKPREEQGFCATEMPSSLQATPPSFGKVLFTQNCQTCHALDKNLTGPALHGFQERGPWADRKELYKWIKNPTAYMKKDSYTKALQIQYGAVCMPSPQLTHKEIDAIVNYMAAPVY